MGGKTKTLNQLSEISHLIPCLIRTCSRPTMHITFVLIVPVFPQRSRSSEALMLHHVAPCQNITTRTRRTEVKRSKPEFVKEIL